MARTQSINNEVRRRKELAEALTAAIFATNEGWVVSAPNEKNLRVEILQGSVLSDVLAEKYRLTPAGTSQRLLTNAIETEMKGAHGHVIRRNTHHGQVTVSVFILELP
jgi:hypothetical protein